MLAVIISPHGSMTIPLDEATLSQELRTTRLLWPHVLVGYRWQHTGLHPRPFSPVITDTCVTSCRNPPRTGCASFPGIQLSSVSFRYCAPRAASILDVLMVLAAHDQGLALARGHASDPGGVRRQNVRRVQAARS
jgi:hypothetical protein